ncbi:MAG: hypothetical protein KDD40_08220, partial [Bdellovibrionales bacterium]|nr:hypothetical protein [Bdellovibrionales bacterium]
MKTLRNLLNQLNICFLVISMAAPHPAFANNSANTAQQTNSQLTPNETLENTPLEDEENIDSLDMMDETEVSENLTPPPAAKKTTELTAEQQAENTAREARFNLANTINSQKLKKKNAGSKIFDKLEQLEMDLRIFNESVVNFKTDILRGKWPNNSTVGNNQLHQYTQQLQNWKQQLIGHLPQITFETSAAARVNIQQYFNSAFDLIFIRAFFQSTVELQPLQALADSFSIVLPEDIYIKVYPARQLLNNNIDVMAYLNSKGKFVALRWKKSQIFAQLVSTFNVGDANKNYLPLVRCLLATMLYSDLANTNLYLRSSDKNLVDQGLANSALCKGVTHQELLETFQYEKQIPHLENEVRTHLLSAPYFLRDVLAHNKTFRDLAIEGQRITPDAKGTGKLSAVKIYYPYIYLFPKLVEENIPDIDQLSNDEKAKILTKDEVITLQEAITQSRDEYAREFDPKMYDMGLNSGLTEKLSELF